jgi:hypothetical protein
MPYNRVPEGRAGTGEAYILPESKALNGLIDTIEYNRKMGLLNVRAENDYKDKVNKSYKDNQLKAENGLLFNNELNGYFQNHLKKGAAYRNKGFDIYNPDPSRPDQVAASEDYLKERAQLQSMMDLRKSHETNYMSQLKEAQTGKYDEDSVKALHDFYTDNGSRLKEIQEAGATLPMLTPAFNPLDVLGKVKAASIKENIINGNVETTTVAPNMAAIRFGVESALSNNPQGQRWLKKQVGESPVPILGTRNPEEIQKYLSDYYVSPDGVKEALKAFPAGTVPSVNSPEFQNFLKKKTNEQLASEHRYEGVMEDLSLQKAAEVNQQNIKDYNFDAENQAFKRADQRKKEIKFGWDSENQANTRKEREEKDTEINQRDKWLKGLQIGNTEHVQRLRQLAKSKGGNVYFMDNGGMRVTWNEKSGSNYVKRSQEIDVTERSEQGYTQMNELLNTLAGKKIPVEKLLGTPGYEGGLVNIGKQSLKKEQVEYLREKFAGDPKALGDMLRENGIFKYHKEAYEAASQILDKKGKIHIVK